MNDENQQMIDEDQNKQEAEKPLTIIDFLQFELRQHMEIALEYKNKIDGAKTTTKKDYFKKKLQKNNVQAMKVLTALERVTQQKAAVYENEPSEQTPQ